MSTAVAITYLRQMEIFPFKQQQLCLGYDARIWSYLLVPFLFIDILDLEKLVESTWGRGHPEPGTKILL